MSKSANPVASVETNLDQYRADLKALVERGELLLHSLCAKYVPEQFDAAYKKAGTDVKAYRAQLPPFKTAYQAWYSEALALIRQLLPDRVADFEQHYKKPKTRKGITFENYRIEDALQGLTVTRTALQEKVVGPDAAIPHVEQQLAILRAVERRFESSLFDIRQLVQADLFDSELDAARELLKSGFGRAAGAVSGVVLERHLGQVAQNHQLVTRKAHPTISDFNDLLKTSNVLDVPAWRQVQRLGDLRNLCDHNKHRDPANEEVEELISGIEKLTKTLF